MNIISTEQRLLPQASLPQVVRPAPETVADVLGVNAVLRTLRRRMVLMLTVAAIIGAFILAKSMMATPMYRASALVALNVREERVLNQSSDVLGELPRDAAAIETEIEIMKSQKLKAQLVDTLDLTRDPEWNWMLREPPKWKTFVASLLSPVLRSDAEPSEAVDPMSVIDEPWLKNAIANSVGGAIQIHRRGLTYVIEISAASRDPVRAQEIANTFADLYLASQGEAREEAAKRATSWLSDRLEALRADVQRKEAAVVAFREQMGLTGVDGDQSLLEQQIVAMQSDVLAAKSDLADKQTRYRQFRQAQARGDSLESFSSVVTDSRIVDLRAREADVKRRQAELENRYLPTHPDVQAVRTERESINEQIQEAIERVASNLESEVDRARSQVQVLQSALDEATAALQKQTSQTIRLKELESEAAASRAIYDSYLQRYEVIVNQASMNNTDARLVSHAEAGYQVAPNLRVSLVLAIMAGGFCGIVVGVAAELLDRSVRSRDEIESKIGYPAITAIPSISKAALRSVPRTSRTPPGYLVEKPMSAFTEALRVLRTVIVHSHLGSASRVVAIASALPGEGKTTVAMSLARVAALSGQKVVLVDCDLRKQSINGFLSVKPQTGLIQALTGETSWREAIHKDDRSQADILPIAESAFTSLDIFGSDSMELLLSELRESYEIVVLDCPPLFAVADARVVCSLADSVVIVVRMGKSAMDAVRLAVDQVVSVGGKVAGVALNRVPMGGFGRFAYGDTGYAHEARSYYSTA